MKEKHTNYEAAKGLLLRNKYQCRWEKRIEVAGKLFFIISGWWGPARGFFILQGHPTNVVYSFTEQGVPQDWAGFESWLSGVDPVQPSQPDKDARIVALELDVQKLEGTVQALHNTIRSISGVR